MADSFMGCPAVSCRYTYCQRPDSSGHGGCGGPCAGPLHIGHEQPQHVCGRLLEPPLVQGRAAAITEPECRSGQLQPFAGTVAGLQYGCQELPFHLQHEQ